MTNKKRGGGDYDCFACGKPLKKWAYEVESSDGNKLTVHGQMQWVGADCYRKIRKSADIGLQVHPGGLRLFDTLGPSCKVDLDRFRNERVK